MKFDLNDHKSFPKRQIHLDFHTQPNLMGVGSRFSKENFQKALIEGNVSSITVFARCYHGLCYYPTEKGLRHPGCDFDLTGAMVDAAHEIGVRAPIYINSGMAHIEAEAHPEWVSRKQNGEIDDVSYVGDEPNLRWPFMCLNHGGSYTKHLYEIIEEVCARYEQVDGLFLDICFGGGPCFCDDCKRGMAEMGLDPNELSSAKKYYIIKRVEFMKHVKSILDKYHEGASVFFNTGGADIRLTDFHPHSTHFEIEDLPTIGLGYDKMPLNATFFESTGKLYFGMTGKFHLEWGEFGGFKHKEALRYEAATMAVYGAGCSIGDHMLFDGEMDMDTYKNVGHAFRYYEKIEPYCFGKSLAKIGVCLSERDDDNFGLSNMLLEKHIDFAAVHNFDFDSFDTVIFPGGLVLDDEPLEKLKKYIQNGGKVLFAGDALIKDGKFQIDCGLTNPTYEKDGGDYIKASPKLEGELPESPFYAYYTAIHPENVDAEILAETLTPYCNHAYGKWGKVTNLPYEKDAKRYPALAKKGNVVYMAHPLPAIYKNYGCLFHRNYFLAALELLAPEQIVKIDFGAQGRCRMIKQEDENRYCINMTYAAPVKRGRAEIIEDIVPIYDIPISVKVPEKITSVTLPLKDKEIPFTYENGWVSFKLDKLQCHETLVLKY